MINRNSSENEKKKGSERSGRLNQSPIHRRREVSQDKLHEDLLSISFAGVHLTEDKIREIEAHLYGDRIESENIVEQEQVYGSIEQEKVLETPIQQQETQGPMQDKEKQINASMRRARKKSRTWQKIKYAFNEKPDPMKGPRLNHRRGQLNKAHLDLEKKAGELQPEQQITMGKDKMMSGGLKTVSTVLAAGPFNEGVIVPITHAIAHNWIAPDLERLVVIPTALGLVYTGGRKFRRGFESWRNGHARIKVKYDTKKVDEEIAYQDRKTENNNKYPRSFFKRYMNNHFPNFPPTRWFFQ